MSDEQPTVTKLPGAFSLFRPSYEAIMVNIWTFLVLLLLPIAGAIVNSSFGGGLGHGGPVEIPLGVSVFSFLSGIIGLLVAPAIPFVQLQSVRGHEVSIGEALKVGKKFFWRFYGLALLTVLMVLGGFLLLIVPGFFMIKRYILAPFYMYDHDLGIREAMGHSRADSKPFADALWGLIAISVVIAFLGVIPFLAVLAAVLQVVYYCAPTVRYEQIQAVTHHAIKPKAKKKKTTAKKSA